MRRPRKNDKGSGTSTGWTMTEAGRHSMANDLRARPGRHGPLVWAVRLSIALLVLAGAVPYLRGEDLGTTLDRLFNSLPSPVDPGDQNGLLHR